MMSSSFIAKRWLAAGRGAVERFLRAEDGVALVDLRHFNINAHLSGFCSWVFSCHLCIKFPYCLEPNSSFRQLALARQGKCLGQCPSPNHELIFVIPFNKVRGKNLIPLLKFDRTSNKRKHAFHYNPSKRL